MDSGLIPMDEPTGEYDETYEVATAPSATADGLGPALVILTSIFLLISIVMISIRLYTAYDLFKSQKNIITREQAAKTR